MFVENCRQESTKTNPLKKKFQFTIVVGDVRPQNWPPNVAHKLSCIFRDQSLISISNNNLKKSAELKLAAPHECRRVQRNVHLTVSSRVASLRAPTQARRPFFFFKCTVTGFCLFSYINITFKIA